MAGAPCAREFVKVSTAYNLHEEATSFHNWGQCASGGSPEWGAARGSFAPQSELRSALRRQALSPFNALFADACGRAKEPNRRRCRIHGGAPGTGAPRENTNARRHGRYSVQSREIRALGRVQNRTADLLKAQLAALEALACGDDRRVAVTEERVAHCMQRLRRAALVLDRVLAERGDEEGRRRLVEAALRLADNV
jgi:hypothetical protein